MVTSPLVGEPLVIDLLNSCVRERGELVDLLGDDRTLTQWVARHPAELAELQGRKLRCVDDVRRLREVIRRLLAVVGADQRPDDADLSALNNAAGMSPATVRAIVTANGLQAERVGSRNADDLLLTRIAEEAIDFLTGPLARRVRQCQGPGCVLLFVPAHPARRWCSPTTCGNRVRVARHYRQHKAVDP